MPNHLLRLPRSIFTLLIVLIASGLIFGAFHLSIPARAQAVASPAPTFIQTDTPSPEIPTLPGGFKSADTTGVVTQAIVLVAIVIFGAFWGWRNSIHRPPRKTKI